MVSERAMRRLWVFMAEAYGEHWTKHFDLEPNDTWRAALRPFEDPDVSAGALAAVTSARAFPPTLPEFHRYCAVAARERIRALPAPETHDVPLRAMRGQSLVVLALAAGIDVEQRSRDEIVAALETRRLGDR